MGMIIDKYNEWVADGGYGSPDAIRRVSAVMRQDAKDRRASKRGKFRASLMGDPCVRKRQLSYMQAEETDTDNTFAVMGTWGHYRWQLAGLTIGFLNDIEVKVRGKNYAGHADGTVIDGRLFEFKTTNASFLNKLKNDEEDIPEGHIMQMQSLLHYGPWDEAVIVYEDRAYGGKEEVAVPYSPYIGQMIDSNVAELVDFQRKGILVKMHEDCVPGSKMRLQCGFKDACLHRWMDESE